MVRPKLKDNEQISLYLNKQLIAVLYSYAKASELSLSEYAENILMGGLSASSQIPLIEALQQEVKTLELLNKKHKKKVENNILLIEQKNRAIKQSHKSKNEFLDIKEALDKNADERKEHFLNILERKIMDGEEIIEVKRTAIKHSALLNQKYKWEELLSEAMKKAKPGATK